MCSILLPTYLPDAKKQSSGLGKSPAFLAGNSHSQAVQGATPFWGHRLPPSTGFRFTSIYTIKNLIVIDMGI